MRLALPDYQSLFQHLKIHVSSGVLENKKMEAAIKNLSFKLLSYSEKKV